jgi:hypothetical protein
MIFLKQQNLLFIKPHKTASTSVEIALSCAPADPADIITPLIPDDERQRAETGGRLPLNWAWLKGTEQRYLRDFSIFQATGTVPRRWLPGGHGKLYSKLSARFYNHMTPQAIRARGGRRMLDSAFLVSMVRHPYEQIVSWAWHQKKLRGSDAPLPALIDAGLALPSPNLPYLFDARRPDFVIRYETMAADLARLSDRAGADLNAHLPFAKGGHRTDRAAAADLLTAAQKDALFVRDRLIFESFGYDR